MKRIGIISDTHGTFDDTLRRFLQNVDEIWHAGDFGSLELFNVEFVKLARHLAFTVDGYRFAQQQSHGSQPVFEEIGLIF